VGIVFQCRVLIPVAPYR